MSCNITSGIAKGCNDQVGGIVGIHYMKWYPDLQVDKDPNGVITRVYRSGVNSSNRLPWEYIDCSNIQGSVTETYNVNTNGSILGFHQSAQFFMPMTATPLGSSLLEFIEMIAVQNNLVIGIETGNNSPMRGYSKKCFVFGLERPAYCAGGSKETGITYNDNNGYTMELAADSKEPMQEIAYMALHRTPNMFKHYSVTDWSFDNMDYFSLEELVPFEGDNIKRLGISPNFFYPDIYVQPGETLTVVCLIAMDWGPNAFSGTTFLPEWEIGYGMGAPLVYDTTYKPLPTAPGYKVLQLKGSWTNIYGGSIGGIMPVRLVTPTGVNISGGAERPFVAFNTITRTS